MSGASAQHIDFLGNRMNNSGQVAVYAYPAAGGFPQTIYLGNGGPLSHVAQRTSNGENLSEPSLNDAGSVIYLFKAAAGNTAPGIYKYDDGSTTTVIAPSITNGLSADSNPQINNQEMIAYVGRLGGKTGLIIGDGSTFANVISVGDSLFGSTVRSIDSDFTLNDRGDIAFLYNLANGRSGVALAVAAPEPTAILLAAFGAACMLCRLRRAR